MGFFPCRQETEAFSLLARLSYSYLFALKWCFPNPAEFTQYQFVSQMSYPQEFAQVTLLPDWTYGITSLLDEGFFSCLSSCLTMTQQTYTMCPFHLAFPEMFTLSAAPKLIPTTTSQPSQLLAIQNQAKAWLQTDMRNGMWKNESTNRVPREKNHNAEGSEIQQVLWSSFSKRKVPHAIQ